MLLSDVEASERKTSLTSISISDWMAKTDPLGTGIIDLREVCFISPATEVQLAALCHALAAAGNRPTILSNSSQDVVFRYLVRSGFYRTVLDIADVEPIPTQTQLTMSQLYEGSNVFLIEVSRIEHGTDLPALMDRIVLVLRRRLGYKKLDAFDVTTAISEVAQNTFDHNSGKSGFLALQAYGKAGKRFLEIGISDHGDGLATTLRKNSTIRAVRSDLDALQLAVQPGISEYADRTRGTGLFHLLDIAARHNGTAQIWSGTGKVRYRPGNSRGLRFVVPNCPGVHVCLNFPTKRAA